jgi:NADH-quinone oxidoreductase subunit F
MLFNEPHPLETKVLTRRFGKPDSAAIDGYLADDGYQGFLKAAKMKPEEIIEQVKASNLRGRGGAGSPPDMRWRYVRRREHNSK